MSSLRGQVLHCFKRLHLTRKSVFRGDTATIEAARNKINEEFKMNSKLTEEPKIKELIKLAKEVEIELRTSVVQAKLKEPGVFELQITKDTKKLDNVIFNELASPPPPKTRKCK